MKNIKSSQRHILHRFKLKVCLSISVVCLIFSQNNLRSQTIECQTGVASPSFVTPVPAFYTDNDTLNYYYALRLPTSVAVKLHLVRQSDGSGGLDTAQVAQIVPQLNSAFSNADSSFDTRIRFTRVGAISVINNSTLFQVDNETELQTLFQINRAPNCLNIYVV
jgi:hypothetical protein